MFPAVRVIISLMSTKGREKNNEKEIRKRINHSNAGTLKGSRSAYTTGASKVISLMPQQKIRLLTSAQVQKVPASFHTGIFSDNRSKSPSYAVNH